MDRTIEESAQGALWNGSAGRAWVDSQQVLDRVLAPFQDILIEAIVAGSGGHVLDVGCGTGSTSLAIARRLGEGGRCVGVDISEPMLTRARERAGVEPRPPSFVWADAETYAFEAESFDRVVSRFGVMFFANPVAAFANLRRAAKPEGELRFVAWRKADENPFMTTAERVAAPLLPNLPPRHPNEPGQFAFGDAQRVRTILEDSGWLDVDLQPIDVPCSMPESDLDEYVTRMGPVGRVLHEADASLRAEFLKRARMAYEPYVHGAVVEFVGACWLVRARASTRERVSAASLS
jgi:SAM-dependent methyltransferase